MVNYEEFERHATKWRLETRFTSSMTMMVKHPSYRAIVLMGERAIPWMLEDMDKSPDHWHSALAEITGVDPVPEFANGDLVAITHVWLEWGKANGYYRKGAWIYPKTQPELTHP